MFSVFVILVPMVMCTMGVIGSFKMISSDIVGILSAASFYGFCVLNIVVVLKSSEGLFPRYALRKRLELKKSISELESTLEKLQIEVDERKND